MWPKLKNIVQYRAEAYTGKPPTIRTLRRRIDNGTIPGERQGCNYYVLVGPNNELMPRPETDDKVNALIDNWLEEMPHVRNTA